MATAGSGVITTSLVIQFTDPTEGATGAHLSAEIDGRPDGFNKGVTQFFMGDTPTFLIYKTPDVSTEMTMTDGSASPIGIATIKMKDYLTFAKTNEAGLSKPPSGNVTLTAIGGGTATLQIIGTRVIAKEAFLGIYKAEYVTMPTAYRLTGATAEAVLIFIEGTLPVPPV